MRNRYKKNKYYPDVMDAIERNYTRLIAVCCTRHIKGCGFLSVEDIFQDTIIFICGDSKAVGLPDKEFIAHFEHRLKMIEFQTIQDNKQRKETPYADYLQTKEDMP